MTLGELLAITSEKTEISVMHDNNVMVYVGTVKDALKEIAADHCALPVTSQYIVNYVDFKPDRTEEGKILNNKAATTFKARVSVESKLSIVLPPQKVN